MSQFAGVITALITPFKNGEIDFQSYRKLIHFQLAQGVQGLVVNGTTGESPTLNYNEREKLLEFTLSEVGNQVPILMGTGSNNTATTIQATQLAEKGGAQGALIVTPYYNKPPQRGLVEHFTKVASLTELPILLYNVPGRTGCSMTAETIAELAQVKNIVGVKEASGDLEFAKKLKSQCPKDFSLISGEDSNFLEFMTLGGVGVISVLSHVLCKQMRELIRLEKTQAQAREFFQPFAELTKLLFCEANPIPVKAAMKLMGIIESDELRLPLVPLEANNREKLKAELKKVGVL